MEAHKCELWHVYEAYQPDGSQLVDIDSPEGDILENIKTHPDAKCDLLSSAAAAEILARGYSADIERTFRATAGFAGVGFVMKKPPQEYRITEFRFFFGTQGQYATLRIVRNPSLENEQRGLLCDRSLCLFAGPPVATGWLHATRTPDDGGRP